MKLVDLCPYWTTPPRGGGQLRVHNLNRALSEDIEVEQWSFRPTLNDVNDQLSLRKEVRVNSRYSEHQVLSPLVMATALLAGGLKTHPDAYLSSVLRLQFHSNAQTAVNRASIVQVEHPWLFEYASRHRSPSTPIVLSSHNIEGELLRNKPIPPRTQLLSHVETLERKAIREADAVTAVTDEDAEQLRNIRGRDDVVVVPHGVDTMRFRPVSQERREECKALLGVAGKTVIVFAGGVHYPNIDAALFLREIAPTFSQRNVAFVVVGRAARRSWSRSNFICTGFVPDVLQFYGAADFAMVPLATGSGSSLKTLEFLAMGIPVITTPAGARGLRIRDEHEAIVRGRSQFSGALGDLMADRGLAERLSASGREYVERNHLWRQGAKATLQIYKALTDGHRG